MSEERTMYDEILDKLEDKYWLMHVDYRDEVPDDYYSTLLGAGRDAWWRALEDAETWYDRVGAAYDAVDDAARAAGYVLSSPFVSIDPDEHWSLVEQVLERDQSSVEDIVHELTRRDQVLLGIVVADEWFEWDADRAAVAATFDVDPDEAWLGPVVAQGAGCPTILAAVDGDELMRFFRHLAEQEEATVGMRFVELEYQDAGLLDQLSGSGWIEDLPERRTMTFALPFFLEHAWIDNDPNRKTSWTAVTGGARAASQGSIRLLGADMSVVA